VPILLQKSKIERHRKSRESRFLENLAAAMLSGANTKVGGRSGMKQCGPSRLRTRSGGVTSSFCALKAQCTKGPQRRIKRWEDEYVVDAVQARLDRNPDAMRTRRETVEHPFGTLKMRMGATHFLMKTLPRVATEMALNVLAYNLSRVMNIVGIKPFLAAVRA
jgi:DDE family transposase